MVCGVSGSLRGGEGTHEAGRAALYQPIRRKFHVLVTGMEMLNIHPGCLHFPEDKRRS